MKRYSTLFPEVDQYQFLSNDSGAGIPWTPNIYPGMNGPVRHWTRDGGVRIAGWMNALQQGTAEAGVKMRLNVHSAGFPSELVASAAEKCAPGVFVRGQNRHNETWAGGGANLPGGIWASFYPVIGLGSPVNFIGGLQGVYNGQSGAPAEIGVYEADIPFAHTLLQAFFADPGSGSVRRAEMLLRAAELFCGDAMGAETVVGAWKNIDRALHAIGQVRQKGFGLALPFCCVSMRWLIRPLVPEPEKLTEEEKAHYLPFLGACPDAGGRERVYAGPQSSG